jgi:hypothetical protein
VGLLEIKIRNVDPIAVKKIDEMAKRKNISRQEFLKSAVEKVAYEKEVSEKDARLEMIISKNIEVMEQMSNSVTRLENLLADLMEE